ncbi:MAG: NAD(P)H-dependent oxidoreductase [Armatimonadetes bacterium]|nr:NAD(P)H-dependent oxidoreductase [Armatimonadota bacterium]
MSPLTVFGIAGTAREGSYNRKLLAVAMRKVAERGHAPNLWDVREKRIPMFEHDLEEERGAFPEIVKALRADIKAADAVVLASPEYNAGVTPTLKSIIDWASRTDPETKEPQVWAGKVVLVIGASPGLFGASRVQIALRQTLAHVAAIQLPESLTLSKAHESFDDNGELTAEWAAKGLDKALDAMLAMAQLRKA